MNGPAPLLTLNNGVRMPALGLGVYQSAPDETVTAVTTAIENGYRLIDTAAAYGNEKEVGEGIARSGIDRQDIFVITKLWLTDYGYDSALRAFDTSMTKLGLDQLDLYLLHWPVPSAFDTTVASYKAAEKLLADGRVRAIGVCNHSPEHLTDLMARTDVVPAVNQVELHPHFSQPRVRASDARHRIVTQSWSPIGGVTRYWDDRPDQVRDPLQNPAITGLADTYGKTPAQIILRWHVEHGLCAIPKSVTPHRIAENIGVFDFSLTPHEVAAIDALDTGVRGGPDPDRVGPDTFS
ncbi:MULTISPECIES: aldo/keto reductase [Streptomyces]|uniref:Diketogulonate reductase-like aldo/keto reductase n=2 Tax=Streptomyces TaxID=1883 RepID=A0ABT9L3Q8_9ACTN|nr:MULTISPECIES: aldo/keto reductase [Streptomyces]MBW8091797.1 aldo/keto reductase [Streptomyces hygroscopicus subsp. hygroscopicus]MDP9614960.1 diketogulonate reductase-like aldo/keto reductase [Streptomyces demainii]GHJ32843.1 oxidoreductase [Streptomyces hygroscopicus]